MTSTMTWPAPATKVPVAGAAGAACDLPSAAALACLTDAAVYVPAAMLGCEVETITAGFAALGCAAGAFACACAATATPTGLGPTVVLCGLAAAGPKALPTIETAIDASQDPPLARSRERWIGQYPI